MEMTTALAALTALANDTRLAIFRMLVQQGPEGLPAGEIGADVKVAAATLSFHLKELERAGLVHARRAGRQIFYAADHAQMRGLLTFLTEDCCGGHPEICGPLPAAAADAACCPPARRSRKTRKETA